MDYCMEKANCSWVNINIKHLQQKRQIQTVADEKSAGTQANEQYEELLANTEKRKFC